MHAPSLLETLGSPGVLAVTLGFAAWWALHRDRLPVERSTLFVGLLVIAVLGPLGVRLLTTPEPFDAIWVERAADRYEEIWRGLDEASLTGASSLEALDLEAAPRLALFEALSSARAADTTFVLLDPAGRAAAWAGEGLLHDVESLDLPSTGSAFHSGFSAVTLASVRRVGGQRTAWRLIAGRSFSSQRLPFPSPSGGRRADFLWAVAREGARLPEAAVAVELEGRPTLAALIADGAPFGGASRRLFLLQLSWIALGLAGLAMSRWPAVIGGRSNWLDVRSLIGVAALGVGLGLTVTFVLLLGAAMGLALGASRRVGRPLSPALGRLVSLTAVGLIVLLAYRLEKVLGPVDLAGSVLPDARGVALAATIFFVMLAGLLPSARFDAAFRADRPRLWLWPLLLLVLGAILADRGAAGVLVVALAAVLASRWLARTRLAGVLGALALVTAAALLAAGTWEVAYRSLIARYLERDVTPALGPPSETEASALRSGVEEFFRDFDLASMAPIDPGSLDPRDLAYALWNRSPLASAGQLSSLAVSLDGATVSSFQYGIPLTRIGEVDLAPELWQELEIPGWEDALTIGRTYLQFEGRVAGSILYALLPRPGFRLVTEPPEQLAATLVRGNLAGRLPIAEVAGPGSFAVYADRPRAAIGPDDAPALHTEQLAMPRFSLVEEGSRIRGWTHRAPETVEVILLRDPGPLESLERIGVQTLGTLLVLGCLALLLVATGGVRLERLTSAWHRLYRSYSKKLVLLYGVMLLIPLLAVTLALLGVVGERLERARETAGSAAMDAAQHVLGEYVLSLEPGFGVDTALDDALLAWLARVVQHEVNLYWGSTLYASSNPELFTAGLLPPRIPGEIYAELSLESARSASRVNQASGQRYLEIYAPLRIPGVGSQELLFLSIPLLAQQEEVQREIASLRTRAVLVALVLMVAVIAMAARLSRGFTRPLTDLIAATEAIAAGARSVDLRPSELELAALADAVNSMAERVAEARERLTVEKQVVDKVVQNITAGVVSLDHDRRVLLCNEVARQLLGVEVGDRLEEALARRPSAAPLLDLAREARAETLQRTVRLERDEGEEGEWTVVWVPVPGEGEPTSLLVIEDVTEVLRGQRLEAWAEMARMIAHEIKNPLTPIRLSTEHMVQVRSDEPDQFDAVFERCVRNILEQVDELQVIASEFSTYSRIPRIQPVEGDLVSAVRRIAESYATAPPERLSVRFDPTEEELSTAFDRRMLGRAVRNLIENALRASRDGGEVVVRVRRRDGEAEIAVEDRGQGADDETLRRMFDPYFSTDSAGTGLGLPISRRIVEEHGGAITASRRRGGGLVVSIRLPIRDPAVSSDSRAP